MPQPRARSSLPSPPGGSLGNLLAIVGAFSFAGYLAAGRVVRSSVGTLGYVAVAYGAAALVSLDVGLAFRTNLTDYDPYTFFMFLLIASIPMMMGHTVFNYLLGRYRAVTIAAGTLREPIGATLLAVPILGEVPTGTVTLGAGVALPLQAIGIAATLLGLFVVIREEIKASR